MLRNIIQTSTRDSEEGDANNLRRPATLSGTQPPNENSPLVSRNTIDYLRSSSSLHERPTRGGISSQISPSATSTVETNTLIDQSASGNVGVGLASSIRSGTRNVRSGAPSDDMRIEVSFRFEENDNQSSNNNENNDEMRDRSRRSHGMGQSQSGAESVLSSDIENGTENQINDTNANNNMNDNGQDFLSRTRRRLHCLFVTITCPIIPLLSVLFVSLFRMIYYANFGDDGKSCTQPLRTYSYLSFYLFIYTLNHTRIKRFVSRQFNSLLRQSRGNASNYNAIPAGVNAPINNDDNDDNNVTGTDRSQNEGTSSQQQQRQMTEDRNANFERLYHHVFISFCVFYIYLGKTWITSCSATQKKSHLCYDDPTIPCPSQCGCPELYSAVKNYVMTLCIVLAFFLTPLIFLPCIYVWIVRGATADAVEAATNGRGLGTDDGVENTLSRWTVNQVLDRMEEVKLNDIQGSRGNRLENKSTYKNAKECCICMMEFGSPESAEKIVIRTKCGHLFHRDCLAGWLGRNWNIASQNQGDSSSLDARAIRRVCPLCREDLIPESSPPSSNRSTSPLTIL